MIKDSKYSIYCLRRHKGKEASIPKIKYVKKLKLKCLFLIGKIQLYIRNEQDRITTTHLLVGNFPS